MRQGDHLSPFLFVVVMEVFNRMMTASVERGFMSRFFEGLRDQEEMEVSHLLFADDTVIFCESNVEQIQNLRCLLLCFEAVSGLMINLSKSDIIPMGEIDDVEGLARIFGCKVASLPITYLGIPLGAHDKASHIWLTIIAKMENKFAG